MLPMACFSATDINDDNELDIMELKNLFWLLEDKEPEHARVLKEMRCIDQDGGGTIDRLEWIQYLVSPDPLTGASYFDFELRNSFLFFDDDHDGFIDIDEFTDFLKQDTRHLTAAATQIELDLVTPIFKKKALEMKKTLCSERDNDNYD